MFEVIMKLITGTGIVLVFAGILAGTRRVLITLLNDKLNAVSSRELTSVDEVKKCILDGESMHQDKLLASLQPIRKELVSQCVSHLTKQMPQEEFHKEFLKPNSHAHLENIFQSINTVQSMASKLEGQDLEYFESFGEDILPSIAYLKELLYRGVAIDDNDLRPLLISLSESLNDIQKEYLIEVKKDLSYEVSIASGLKDIRKDRDVY